MPKITNKKTFTVQTRLILTQDHEITADTIEQALEIGRTWKLSDVVDAHNINDYSVKVVGAYAAKAWDVEQD